MKNIFTGIFLLVSACFMQAQTPNYYRNPDKIYLDSKEGHNGSFTWQMHKADETKDPAEKISQPGYQTGKWMPAIVPGTVLNSLVHNKVYPEPYYGMNNKLDRNIIPDLAKTGREFYTYWFRTEFDVPENYKDKIVWLQVDGINYRAEIWVNGYLLGNMSGMFKPEYINITDFARIGQKNALAIKVYPVDMPGTIKPKQWGAAGEFHNGGDGNIGLNTTMLMSVGWDFTFNDGIRDRNTGIWKNISLYATDKAVIRHPFIKSELSKPNYDLAKETVSVEVTNPTQRGIKCTVKGEIIGENITFSKDLNLFRGETKEICFTPEEFPQLTIKNPRLWWPKGYGSPYLYDANFTFKVGDKVSDSEDFKVGIRQMTFNENNSILSLFINGRRFIGRGGNWGFGESNLNYRGREYDIAVAYHADMNFTMMRNWVGQIGDKELYEACDRHGIMIWQDFWLANPSDGPDPYDPEMFIANAEDYVKRFRNHASIGIYCGRNEGFPPEQIDKALRRIVKEDHPGLHYISSSADEVVSGHGPYRALPVKEYFSLKNGSDKFHSERGMPNVMNYESLVRTFSPEALWPQNAQWGQHDYTMEGAQSCASFNAIIEKGFGKPNNAKEFADLAQWVNYDGYRGMFESRSLNRKGLLLWMTHPAWPSMVWQTYDYYFEPTAAYFGCKKASEPLHIQWNPVTDEIEVVNYSAGLRNGLTAKAQIINMDGSISWENEVSVDSKEDTTNKCMKLDFPASVSSAHFVKLTLTENGKIVSDNFYLRGVEEGNYQALREMPKVTLRSNVATNKGNDGTWTATATLENTSSTPALMIRVNVVGEKDGEQFLPMFYSDNYFSLLPGEKKEINIHWKDVDTRGETPKVVISGYNVN